MASSTPVPTATVTTNVPPASWWHAPVTPDLTAQPRISPTIATQGNMVGVTRKGEGVSVTGFQYVAARPLTTGDLITAELAVAFWWEGGVGATVIPSDTQVELSAPFASSSNQAEVIRLLASLASLSSVHTPIACGCDTPCAVSPSGAYAGVPTCISRRTLLETVGRRAIRGRVYKPIAKGKKEAENAKADGGDAATASAAAALQDLGLAAIFVSSNMLTHSCVPNAAARLLWDTQAGAPAIHLLAMRDIAAEEPISISFVDVLQEAPRRHARLQAIFGKGCECSRCEGARTSPSTVTATSPAAIAAYDDTIAIRCPECRTGVIRLATLAATSTNGTTTGTATAVACGGERGAAGATTSSIVRAPIACPGCDCTLPPPADLADVRELILGAFRGPEDLEPLRKILHDEDTSSLARMFAALPVLAKAKGPAAEIAALSRDVLTACQKLPFFPPLQLIRLAADHGVLCGAASMPEESGKAWELAASLSRKYYASAGTHWIELYEAFASKPPRNPREAATADNMRRMATTL